MKKFAKGAWNSFFGGFDYRRTTTYLLYWLLLLFTLFLLGAITYVIIASKDGVPENLRLAFFLIYLGGVAICALLVFAIKYTRKIMNKSDQKLSDIFNYPFGK